MPSTLREFPLTDEMIQLVGGQIIRIYAKGTTLYVVNARSELITSSYTGGLFTTMSALKQALIATHEFEEKFIDKFLVRLSEGWLKSVDSAHSNSEHGSSDCPTCACSVQWSLSFLVDHLKQHLATCTEKIDDEGKISYERFYYNKALDYFYDCKACSGTDMPVGPYLIWSSHLPPRIRTELKQRRDLNYVLKQAVSGIFEDINPELFHKSVSHELWVSYCDDASQN
jgi:hypothetical protein